MISCFDVDSSSSGLITDRSSDKSEKGDKSADDESAAKIKSQQLSILDRLLPLWIVLSCSLGFLLGQFQFSADVIQYTTISGGTNILVAFGLMLMMYPPLAKVKWTSILSVFKNYKLLGLTCILNWIVCPFCVYLLAWIFFNANSRTGLMAGLSLVGCARCFAMVLVWNHLAGGDAELCAAIAALNSILTVFLYSPYAFFFLAILPNVMGHEEYAVSIRLLQVTSVVLTYMGIPLFAAISISLVVRKIQGDAFYYDTYVPFIAPLTLGSLLFTVMVIFSSNSHTVLQQLPLALYAAVPMIIYFLIMFIVGYQAAKALGASYPEATAIAFTASSNNLEIAIAVAISSFGLHSDESLMCVVVALIEIPTMLTLLNVTPLIRRHWFERNEKV